MKNVYFKEEANSALSRTMTSLTMQLMALFFPTKSLQTSYKYLVNPHSQRNYTWTNPSPTSTFSVETRLGEVKGYYFEGGAKQVLLVHGWGDIPRSFASYISALQEEGYSVWCFDQIGHGYSEGEESHLFGYIDGLKEMIHYIETMKGKKLDALISHSMGGASILNLDETYLHDKKIVIVSIPFKMFDNMFTGLKASGIPKKILLKLLEDLSNTYHQDWQELQPSRHAHKLKANVLMLHDSIDKFCPYKDVEEAVQGKEAKLIRTENLGHRRMLKNKDVIAHILEFLNEMGSTRKI